MLEDFVIKDGQKQYCPSMNATSIALFIKYKQSPPGTILKDKHGMTLLEFKTRVITCLGGWRDPGNVDQLILAVAAVDTTCNQTGEYAENCADCWEVCQPEYHGGKPWVATGCCVHATSHLWRKGNPCESQDVKNASTWSKTNGQSYKKYGNTGLLPKQLLALRAKLVNSGDPYDFMIWTAIIRSVELFLRNDEMKNMRVSRNVQEITLQMHTHLC
jgi:hypothetical protein